MVHEGRVPFHEHRELEVDLDVKRALVVALNDRGREIDEAIERGIAASLRRRQLRFTDRRLVILYVTMVLALAVVFGLLRNGLNTSERDRRTFERAVVENCRIGARNASALDGLIDNIIRSVNESKALSASERATRVRLYLAARPQIPACPPEPIQ